ncbi:MAG: hypothetical protein Phog2KO_41140 [Phototrophicaceae bacterium]
MAINIEQSIYQEAANFLVSQPSLDMIANYTVSPAIQHHIDDLLEKSNKQGLSDEERLELEKILAVSHVLTLAKTQARLKLVNKK